MVNTFLKVWKVKETGGHQWAAVTCHRSSYGKSTVAATSSYQLSTWSSIPKLVQIGQYANIFDQSFSRLAS